MKGNRIVYMALLILMGAKAQESDKRAVHLVLDNWHLAASNADFEAYFDKMTPDGVFIGTDATENWQNDAFREFSKPYFDRGRAWSFTAVERNIYINEASDFAWFDELLDTQMKLCRGSGVAKKVNGQWKIAHYVLSIAVPNKNVAELVQLKMEKDSLLLLQMKRN